MTTPVNGTVLVAIDGSYNSVVAAGVGARMAQLLGMQISLLHVLDVPVLSFWVGVEARLKGDSRAQAEAMLADISKKIQLTCDVALNYYIADGEPTDEIHKMVRAHPEIVMVVTGRDGVGSEKKTELLRERAGDHLGAKLADMLPVPVLVVPPDVSESMICESLDEYRKKPGA
jgi:nucleotide-binding universal stress UspA family protein